MKGSHTHPFVLFILSVLIGLAPGGHLAAQPFATLYSFTNGNDGANPYGVPYGLVLSGNTLYGTANAGGTNGTGAIFAIETDGTGFTNLYSFTAVDPTSGTNADGAEPNGVILSGGTLYGTTFVGGSNGNGTIFALSTNGTDFTNLYSFSATNEQTGANLDGANPAAGVIISGSTLYGTTAYGGSAANGTLFSVGTNGQNFVPMHSFSLVSGNNYTNNDGADPQQALVLSGGTLYGTAQYGGSNGFGCIFTIKTGGGGFTDVYAFSPVGSGPLYPNHDGAYPNGIVLLGNMLYGTANIGGSNGSGSVFGIGTNGSELTNLYSFTATNAEGDNVDGAYPFASVAIAGNTIYGVTGFGGQSGNGALFAINTNGTGFTNFHNFSGTNLNGMNSDGAVPQAGLIVSNDVVYGTAFFGGSNGYGTVFSISFEPTLTIASSKGNIVLTWPTNTAGFSYAGFALQSATNLIPPVTWSAVSPAPTVVNGAYTVTNTATAAPTFYRLNQ